MQKFELSKDDVEFVRQCLLTIEMKGTFKEITILQGKAASVLNALESPCKEVESDEESE